MKIPLWFVILGCLLLTWPQAGCGALAGRSGTIIPDGASTASLEGFQVLKGYRYYVSGPLAHPNALIGIDGRYTLADDIWRPIEATSGALRAAVTGIQTKSLSLNQVPQGFAIHDDRGNRIGLWYSILSARTGVVMVDDRTVLIYTPDINTYHDLYDADSGL